MNRDELELRTEAAKAGDDRITEVCRQQEERFEKPRPDLELQKGWLDEAEIKAEQDADLEHMSICVNCDRDLRTTACIRVKFARLAHMAHQGAIVIVYSRVAELGVCNLSS